MNSRIEEKYVKIYNDQILNNMDPDSFIDLFNSNNPIFMKLLKENKILFTTMNDTHVIERYMVSLLGKIYHMKNNEEIREFLSAENLFAFIKDEEIRIQVLKLILQLNFNQFYDFVTTIESHELKLDIIEKSFNLNNENSVSLIIEDYYDYLKLYHLVEDIDLFIPIFIKYNTTFLLNDPHEGFIKLFEFYLEDNKNSDSELVRKILSKFINNEFTNDIAFEMTDIWVLIRRDESIIECMKEFGFKIPYEGIHLIEDELEVMGRILGHFRNRVNINSSSDIFIDSNVSNIIDCMYKLNNILDTVTISKVRLQNEIRVKFINDNTLINILNDNMGSDDRIIICGIYNITFIIDQGSISENRFNRIMENTNTSRILWTKSIRDELLNSNALSLGSLENIMQNEIKWMFNIPYDMNKENIISYINQERYNYMHLVKLVPITDHRLLNVDVKGCLLKLELSN